MKKKVVYITSHMQNKRVVGIHIRAGDGYMFDKSLSPRLKDFEVVLDGALWPSPSVNEHHLVSC